MKMQNLKGMHHVTAITSDAVKIYDFYTDVLGLRLVKKTVNQDDIHTYHLFFADDEGNAGTDVTFFDFPGIPKGTHGTDEIARISLRVPSDAAIEYWADRFDKLNIEHSDVETLLGKKIIRFEDFDGQQYNLISDETDKEGSVEPGVAWKNGPVPEEYAIVGLGPIELNVSRYEAFKAVFEEVYGYKEVDSEGDYHLFETGQGGNGGQVIVHKQGGNPGMQGYGTIHHTAFRVNDKEGLDEWIDRLNSYNIGNSGFVERYYFKSLYSKFYPGILVEIATDGPGFTGDEPYETLGEILSLPPFLEPKREAIEDEVRHIDTTRHNQPDRKVQQ
ncbi:ring-cleaving dioxygenase [Staphylococcus carnosus]|uniref:ring-cleaving dioxygenase n=1 Tax=Staphylococcus carnosus TaxID=1281 RepID=UPI000CD1543C|nr:ring-cleaving dioxygenase [Staphylococcus carnosus]POA07592.1 ring-cleaving dioxygenase [Staphylococcus carnosus]QRQ06151.1 ring-cleaving dioxygenase [Staphylococcus carnosus]SUM08781.1 glyoxylase family protein [Staphylococcus carnosus]